MPPSEKRQDEWLPLSPILVLYSVPSLCLPSSWGVPLLCLGYPCGVGPGPAVATKEVVWSVVVSLRGRAVGPGAESVPVVDIPIPAIFPCFNVSSSFAFHLLWR